MTRGWVWIAGVALLALLGWGFEQVIVAPFETGEIYPAFCSLRSDPQGTLALYESLAAQPGINVDRLYKQRSEIADSDEVMLVLGVDPVAWAELDPKVLIEYEKLVKRGGRLVIGFLPARGRAVPESERSVWNLRLRYRKPAAQDDARGIPRESALYLEAGPQWTKGDGFIERTFGAGEIVLVPQTFALSNEGLREARDTQFIAALIGPAHHVVFDENHFGVVETGSVAKLMRKYRLEGAVAVLAVVFALFLWRSASSLLPPRGAPLVESVAGRDSLAGMTALLNRGVAERDLIDVCFAEWSRTDRNPARAARVEQAIRGHGKEPAPAYRAACAALSDKRT